MLLSNSRPPQIVATQSGIAKESNFAFVYTAIILRIHGDYPPLFMELKVIQLADGCTFQWHWNILDVYVLILPTISKHKRIPRFFWEWLCMHKQSIAWGPVCLVEHLPRGIQAAWVQGYVCIFMFQGGLGTRLPLNRSRRSRNKPSCTLYGWIHNSQTVNTCFQSPMNFLPHDVTLNP